MRDMPKTVLGGEMLQKLEPHYFATQNDLMEGDELVQFLKDTEGGILNPGYLYEGQILDGRNRWRAATAHGHAMEFIEIPDDYEDPIELVRLLNNSGREDTFAQRALAAARAKPMYAVLAKKRQEKAGGDKKSEEAKSAQDDEKIASVTSSGSDSDDKSGDARDQAGAAHGVSGPVVDAAEKILDIGCDELIKLVRDEKIGITAAAKFVKKFPDKASQAEICAEGVKAIRAAMKPPKKDTEQQSAETTTAEGSEGSEEDDDFQLTSPVPEKKVKPAKKADCESFLERLKAATEAMYFKFVKDALEAPELPVKPISGMAADRAIMLLAASKPKVQQQAVNTLIYDLPESAQKQILATLLAEPTDGIVTQLRKWAKKKFGAAKVNVIDKPKSEAEVMEYAKELQSSGARSDAPKHAKPFYDNYQSKGWMVDKNKPITDWKSRFNHWCRQMGGESAQDRRVDPGIKLPEESLNDRKKQSAESRRKLQEQGALS